MTCTLKEGLDINKLTTGTDFEVVANGNDPYIEEEEEVEEKLQYQQKIIEHLNPECADFCDDDSESGSADGHGDVDAAMASICVICGVCKK